MIKPLKDRIPVSPSGKQQRNLEATLVICKMEEISELRVENKNLQMANLDCMDWFNALKEDFDSAQTVLNEYGNPLNWTTDDQGTRRVWLEPGSSTPEAYNGFEMAKGVLNKLD